MEEQSVVVEPLRLRNKVERCVALVRAVPGRATQRAGVGRQCKRLTPLRDSNGDPRCHFHQKTRTP